MHLCPEVERYCGELEAEANDQEQQSEGESGVNAIITADHAGDRS